MVLYGLSLFSVRQGFRWYNFVTCICKHYLFAAFIRFWIPGSFLFWFDIITPKIIKFLNLIEFLCMYLVIVSFFVTATFLLSFSKCLSEFLHWKARLPFLRGDNQQVPLEKSLDQLHRTLIDSQILYIYSSYYYYFGLGPFSKEKIKLGW